MPTHLFLHGDVMAEIEKDEDFMTVNVDNFLVRSIPGEFEITLLSTAIDKVKVEEKEGKPAYSVIGRNVIKCRILTTPYVVKNLIEVLDRTFKRYEEQFGSIETKAKKPVEFETDYIR